MSLTLVTAPASEPVTTAEAKAHMNVTTSDDDTLIGGYIAAARQAVEDFTKRKLFTQTWDYRIDGGFPWEIRLPVGPVASISSITYVADDGTSTTLATSVYQTSVYGDTARIQPAYGQTWPHTRPVMDAVTVRFVAGWATVDSIPKAIRQAILELVAHFYEHREAVATVAMHEILLGLRNLLLPWVRND